MWRLKPCQWPQCDREIGKHGARNYCSKHYKQWGRDQGKIQSYNQEYLKVWIRTPNGRYSALKRAAKIKDLGFDISLEQHQAILAIGECHYCKSNLNETGHALDRKDSSKGYLINNVVTCCDDCNSVKNSILTYEEMLVAMKAVIELRSCLIHS